MKKFRNLTFALLIASSTLYSPEVEAREYSFAHVYDNGCIGIRTYHTILWGLIEWVSDEIIACP